MTRTALTLVTAGLALLGLPALAQEASVLRFASPYAVTAFEPLQGKFWMQEFGVAELLMQLHRDGAFHPWLLSDLERVDDLTWTLTVREGVTFHNGRVVDAAAVHAAITHELENASGTAALFPESARFAIAGDYQLTFTADEPFPALPALLAGERVFPIYDVAALEAAGSAPEAIAEAGIYTGPYALESLTLEEFTTIRYDDYWHGEPAMDGFVVRFISDPNARLLAVQNGEVDVASFMPIALLPVVEATEGLHFNPEPAGSNSYSGPINTAIPPFEDVDVRRALVLAIDYDEISEVIFSGVFEPARSFYPPMFDYAHENIATDRDAAARLLDEAGWTLAADGLRYKDGAPLAFNIVFDPNVADLVALANGLQAQLRQVGFAVSPMGVADVYGAYADVEWGLGLHNQSNAEHGRPEQFLSVQLTGDAPRNYGAYSNAEIDAIADELSVTFDAERRRELLIRVQEIMVEEDPGYLAYAVSRPSVVTNAAFSDYTPGARAFNNIDWQTAPNR